MVDIIIYVIIESMKKSLVQRANTLMRILLVVVACVLIVAYFIPDSGFHKLPSYFATILLAFAPNIVRRMGAKISSELEFAYYLFTIPAMVLGIDLDLYKVFYPLDKISHLLSGVLATFGALEIIKKPGKNLKPWLVNLFCFCFAATTAVAWECFEFLYDQLFQGHMQELILPGPEDTMWDMIYAMIGAGITLAIIYISRRTQNSPKKS